MILVFSTYPDEKSADSAAAAILEKKLAACVSIIKIQNSVYRWEGKIEKSPEYLLLMKTTKKAYGELETFIKQTHPHKVPEIIYIDVEGGNKDYLQWVGSSTLSKP
jgi:periplasmic divalent cation tolerance protein